MKSLLICAGALIAAASLAPAQSPGATESKTIGGKKIEIKVAADGTLVGLKNEDKD